MGELTRELETKLENGFVDYVDLIISQINNEPDYNKRQEKREIIVGAIVERLIAELSSDDPKTRELSKESLHRLVDLAVQKYVQ